MEQGDCTVATLVNVSWTPVEGSEAYLVSWSGGSQQVDANTTSMTVTGLAPNTLITIQVQTIIAGTESGATAGSATSCISWLTNIYPNLTLCSSCHGGSGPAGRVFDQTPDSIYNEVTGTCFIAGDGACSSPSMIAPIQSFGDAGGSEWVGQGANNN